MKILSMPGCIRILAKLGIIILLLLSGIACIPILVVGYILSFFSKPLSIRIATITSFLCWTLFDWIFKLSIKMKKPEIPKGYYLVISNHITGADFMLVNAVNKYFLKDSKYSVKDSLFFIPIFYQAIILLKFLVLKRNFESDKSRIIKYLEEIGNYNIPLWFILFCEGTRITNKKLKESQEFCKTKGIEPFNNVLCPRVKGFKLIFENLNKTNMKKILDLTFYCKNGRPDLIQLLFTPKIFEIECDARVIDSEEIKNSEEFVMKSFRRKDKLIEEWKNK